MMPDFLFSPRPELDENEYRPSVMWFWNDAIALTEIENQIKQFHKQKIFEIYVHPMYGMITPYLSEEYFKCIQHAVLCAQKFEMHFWIYDEYNWPSGTSGTLLLTKHPEFRNQIINIASKPSTATIEFQNELTASALWAPFATYEPGYLNTMDSNAVSFFLHSTHQQYKKAIGEEFGKTVKGVFTDEPAISLVSSKDSQIPYSQELDVEIFNQTGCHISDLIEQLSGDSKAPESTISKYIFWKSTAAIFQRCYMKQIADWCKENHLLYTGHLLGEEFLSTGLRQNGNFFTTSQYFDIPGIDSIFSTKAIFSDRFHLAGKMVASVALFSQKKRTLCETFSGSGWNTKICDLKRISNRLLIHGINSHLLMGAYYSLKGFRKFFPGCYPPSHGMGNPLFEHYEAYSNYIASLSHLIANSTQRADTLVLYPLSSAMAQFVSHGVHTWDMDTSLNEDFMYAKLDYALCGTVNSLMALHVEHNIYPEEYLKDAVVNNGSIMIKGCEYRAFILPSVSHLEKHSLSILKQFIKQGGSVLFINQLPESTADTGEPINLFQYPTASTVNELASHILQDNAAPETRTLSHVFNNVSIIISNQMKLGQNEDFLIAMHNYIQNAPISQIAYVARDAPLFLSRREYKKDSELIFIVNDSDTALQVPITFSDEVSKILYHDGQQEPLTLIQSFIQKNKKTAFFKNQCMNDQTRHPLFSYTCSLPAYGCMAVLLDHYQAKRLSSPTTYKMPKYKTEQVVLKNWEFQPLEENNLRLHYTLVCLSQTVESDLLSYNIVRNLFTAGKHRKECDKYTQDERSDLKMCCDFEPGSSYYIATTIFDVNDLPPTGLYLALENLDIYSVYINGNRIDTFQTKPLWNYDDRKYDITNYVQKGANELFIVGMIPTWDAPHTLPFSVIRGNFSIQDGKISVPVNMHSAYSWTEQGYPYYIGKAKYATCLSQINRQVPNHVMLTLITHDVAEISINDHFVGKRCWAPYTFDLTDAWRVDEENEIKIIITSCASNLFASPVNSGLEQPPILTLCFSDF